MERELKARIFWSCYYLDRGVSVALGRPPAISDGDIDVEVRVDDHMIEAGLTVQFPLDVNEDCNDFDVLRQAAMAVDQSLACCPTSLTPFIHFRRLRMIESKIEHVVYRRNRRAPADPALIQDFIDRLAAWKDAIPIEYYDQHPSTQSPQNGIDAFVSQRLILKNFTYMTCS